MPPRLRTHQPQQLQTGGPSNAARHHVVGKQEMPSTLAVKIVCCFLGISAALSMFSGRGIIALLQGIVSITFAVEGFWGAVQYNVVMLRRLFYFFVFLFVSSIVISVFNLILVDDYCQTALEEDLEDCTNSARVFALTSLVFGTVFGPLYIITVSIFYRKIMNVLSSSDGTIRDTSVLSSGVDRLEDYSH